MKRVITTILIVLSIIGSTSASVDLAQARSYRTKSSDVHVSGYYRKNGTYVQPYYRSKADNSTYNNYSCIDYGQCGGKSIPTYTTSTSQAPAINTYFPSSVPVVQKMNSFISVDQVYTPYITPNKTYYITGKTSNDCDKIEVIASNQGKKVYDDYVLEKYHRGDTSFKYGILKGWGNLDQGSNSYTFHAFCGDHMLEAKTTVSQ